MYLYPQARAYIEVKCDRFLTRFRKFSLVFLSTSILRKRCLAAPHHSRTTDNERDVCEAVMPPNLRFIWRQMCRISRPPIFIRSIPRRDLQFSKCSACGSHWEKLCRALNRDQFGFIIRFYNIILLHNTFYCTVHCERKKIKEYCEIR